ncbi:transporter substrate-binding domain-containing protein [Desulfuromonas sp. AOP6]|uniref:ATP-binding protein n=1 Tax=Desulfuromonas sp. AOP6 TaxID=1566351 RepID=UPI0012778C1A|nr:transporter substrate-binding domain-containing protein [Desulfuromonas sp. AOP6]BCA78430.1 hypothetical protein AOP6_0217 [Desulfuromonas sp. AOP6]
MGLFQVLSIETVRFVRTILGVILLCLPVMVGADPGPQPTVAVRVAVLSNSPPLQFYDPEQNRAAGFAVDIFEAVARRQGFKPSYVFADTWSEVIALVSKGQADVAASLAVSEERQQQLVFSEVIDTTPVSVFVRARDAVVTGLDPGTHVGTTEGSFILAHLEKIPDLEVHTYKSVPEGLFALLAGREDAFVAGENLFLKEARDAHLENRIRTLGKPLLDSKRAMAVAPSKPGLLEKLNEGIRELVASPQYREIYIRWYGKPISYWTVKRILALMSGLLAVTIAGLLYWRYQSVNQLHEALSESEARLRQAMDATSDGLWAWDFKNRQVYYNPNYYRMLGFEPGEFRADMTSWQERLHPDDRQDTLAAFETCRTSKGERFEREFRLRDKDGGWIWVLGRGEAVKRSEDGQALKMIGTHVNITALKQAEETMREALRDAEASRDRVNAILESVPDALIVADKDRRLLLMNQEAEKLFGRKGESLTGHSLDEIIRDPLLFDVVSGPRTGDERTQVAYVDLPHPELGGIRHFQAISAAVQGRSGDGSGTVTLLRDITREREVDRMKSEFISIAAHELKTPLTSIIGYADLLLREEELGPFTDEQRQEFLSYIQQKGDVLEHLVDDLLNLSRIEAGRPLVLDRQPCNLTALIRALIPHHQRETDRHHFEIDLPADAVILNVDRGKMEQVFDNLLSNAVKYSPDGGAIRIRGERLEAEFQVTVEDEGLGMTAEQVERIFEKFYRANYQNTAVGGLGLGMSIVRSLVEAHNGKIWVESELGRGTRVFVRLPLASV